MLRTLAVEHGENTSPGSSPGVSSGMTLRANRTAAQSGWTLLLLLLFSTCCLSLEAVEDPRPEQSMIDEIVADEQPQGVVFVVMEDDEEALQWVLPRVVHYTRQLREKWQQLPITLLSHGSEMFSLVSASSSLYPDIQREARKLVTDHSVLFQVCGSFAAMSDFSASDFPDFLDVVPFAPAEIENYRLMEYKIVNLELTW
jgi:intracellular sulfur oxidation DsrE/DsrF family protein